MSRSFPFGSMILMMSLMFVGVWMIGNSFEDDIIWIVMFFGIAIFVIGMIYNMTLRYTWWDSDVPIEEINKSIGNISHVFGDFMEEKPKKEKPEKINIEVHEVIKKRDKNKEVKEWIKSY